jgi:AcrR family transcriptional regulator
MRSNYGSTSTLPPRSIERGGGAPAGPVRREDLLDTAGELLVTKGLLALTTDAVASRAGVPVSTISRWWPSDEALAVDALRYEWLALAVAIRNRAASSLLAQPLTPGER